MTTDDMREIDAALDEFQDASERVYEANPDPAFGDPAQRQKEARKALMAMIRQKLEGNVAHNPATSAQPAADVAQNDAEHERAVEAWRKVVTSLLANPEIADDVWLVNIRDVDEALRLMRARPVADKAADLLRLCGDLREPVQRLRIRVDLHGVGYDQKPEDISSVLGAAKCIVDHIEAAERAGVR